MGGGCYNEGLHHWTVFSTSDELVGCVPGSVLLPLRLRLAQGVAALPGPGSCGFTWPRELRLRLAQGVVCLAQGVVCLAQGVVCLAQGVVWKSRELLVRGVLFSSDPCGLCAISTST